VDTCTIWTAAGTAFAALAALAALVGTWLLHRQLQQEAELSRFAVGVETQWKLDDNWNSARMIAARRNAALSLLAKKPTTDVHDVLDFFESIAALTKKGILDADWVWHNFYYAAANYWSASRDYIGQVRARDSTLWEDLDEDLIPRLIKIQARRRRRPPTPPTDAETSEFLSEEKNLIISESLGPRGQKKN
jgi:hypothetical protein